MVCHTCYKVNIDISPVQSDSMPDWSEVEVVATKQDNNDWYGKTDLINLTPHTQYRVKVASRNNQGYNKFSREHIFTTSKEGNFFLTFESKSTFFFYLLRTSKTEISFSKFITKVFCCFNTMFD